MVAKLAEMDFIVADLERANSRVAAVERRNVRFSPSFFTVDFADWSVHRRFFVLTSRLSEVEAIQMIGNVSVVSTRVV